jgi:hypothetical protein
VAFVLQPHGRDESLITRKMWKHILVQGLYQMFWLFFFMYAAPVLFEQYRITDNCTFIARGPDEDNAGGSGVEQSSSWCRCSLSHFRSALQLSCCLDRHARRLCCER